MIRSMTGFGMTERVIGGIHHRLEVKSVNGKFCDVKVKLPLDLSSFELRIQNVVKQRLARGHVDVLLYRGGATGENPRTLSINWELAEQYYQAFQSIRRKYGIQQDISLAMLSNAREVLTLDQAETDLEQVWAIIEEGLEVSLVNLLKMRETEGAALAEDMRKRIDYLAARLDQVATVAPTVVANYRARLDEKIKTVAGVELDPARLAQEVCLFADRCDITEEMTRLRSHFKQFKAFLEEREPVGRKLDFLVQELNREVNTIGSKCNDAAIAHTVVDMKSEIEKLREQIQNIE